MHYVYLLRCADNSLYVGETSNLQAREQYHNDGRGGSYTAKRRPVCIVYAERHSSKKEALKRERQIKRWSLKKKQLLVRGDAAALSGVSEKARVRAGFTWKDWLARPTEFGPQKYRVGLYVHASDHQLAANQRAAMRHYSENMGWTIMFEMNGEIEPLIHAAAEQAIQLVLCWRLSEMPGAKSLLMRLRTAGVDLLPLAESCAALQE